MLPNEKSTVVQGVQTASAVALQADAVNVPAAQAVQAVQTSEVAATGGLWVSSASTPPLFQNPSVHASTREEPVETHVRVASAGSLFATAAELATASQGAQTVSAVAVPAEDTNVPSAQVIHAEQTSEEDATGGEAPSSASIPTAFQKEAVQVSTRVLFAETHVDTASTLSTA